MTRHATSEWVKLQLREAFPYNSAPKYPIFDRDSIFCTGVVDTVKSFGIQFKRTSFRSPWQNGVAERSVGNCRRDLLDHAEKCAEIVGKAARVAAEILLADEE